MSYTLAYIVEQLGGELRGDDLAVVRLAPLERAGSDEIAFVAHAKLRRQMLASGAGALIVTEALAAELQGRSLIVAADPYLYFARLASLFHPQAQPRAGIHPRAVVGEGARIAASSEIAANVTIGDRVVIGERCRLLPGVVVGDDCVIGDDVTLHPNVTVYHGCVIGNRVGVHSGSVIGADGFGLAWDKDHWFKIPQTGRAVLEDDVEIGANTTVDRGAMADTVIRKGAKIDNLVQIAHNVEIGEHTAIAGCVGIAGSAKIGARCTVGGAAMFVGHIEVADRTHIGGGTLVSKSIKEAGNYASSYPLQSMKDWLSNAVHVRHLDDFAKRVKQLERELETLKKSKEEPHE
ncbi:UDP-3-O-(3-hydroxymyristoyl)glucosamine N-acyltransferase [Chromobacterium subtsugae]|uniref:UDP-3-O-acylglucosamine N-acyltransferase n=1 Tax=Chromobacterium subtsugae TaxID=251747 RepID=A0ABS7FEM5_9NEIS|nr:MULTISPECIES: UDP-3-O-(3-hydroxymyristoyl)glucosamine N-acyltransferase [Chromobacterium]KUM01910.1 UDP-3-O-(3-hydroxymyristoyl) glucosamine N-acyltransferase [Chromobacterium subtsugae]KZE88215.1 UDP-3-O-(3-hydroxymyristoyl)glucosamine N-acyltransferase [Chromobacterium sp. F49]MBW7565604.1 UDP-3-O-(3-hydroxymyristoyl)glucosamine N-acyltransferase [Chromobacterium subtsugae]MBW8287935.1 UDP-3-O-(3-hydroxymyristoyl)glucosamine N-acyltransferase [Chromobacterium subtsugae]OBU86916.1 UDP-3-O-